MRASLSRYYLEKDFILLFVANLLVTSVYFLLMTTMARYATETYDCSGSMAGLTASIFLIGGVLGRVVSGRFANRVGYKRLTLASALVMLASCALYLVSRASIVLLLAVRLVHGLTFGIVGTIMPALAVQRFPKERIGEGTGVFMLSASVGTGVGPLVGLLVAAGFDYDAMFVAVVVMVAVVTLCAALITTGAFNPQLAAADKAQPFSWRSFIDPGTLRIAVFMFIVAFSYSSINSFLNSYSVELGLEFFAPFTFLVYSVGNVLFRPVCGRIMDRSGTNVVLYPSIASMAAGLLLCAFMPGPLGMLGLGVLMAVGFGTCMSTGQALVTKLIDPSKTALAIGTFFIMCDGGCGLGPVFLGALIEPLGFRGMYAAAAGICLVGLLYYHIVCRRADPRRPCAV